MLACREGDDAFPSLPPSSREAIDGLRSTGDLALYIAPPASEAVSPRLPRLRLLLSGLLCLEFNADGDPGGEP